MVPYVCALIILAGVLVAYVQSLHGLYVHFPPYDIFMHVAGGLGIGLFVYALAKSFRKGIPVRRSTIILAVFAVGIVWELFEIYYNIAGYPLWTKAYYIDTAKDLADDILGGIVAAVACRRNT